MMATIAIEKVKQLRSPIAIGIALALGGCALPISATTKEAQCSAWRPITYSKSKDTPETVRQVRTHNLTGKNMNCWK